MQLCETGALDRSLRTNPRWRRRRGLGGRAATFTYAFPPIFFLFFIFHFWLFWHLLLLSCLFFIRNKEIILHEHQSLVTRNTRWQTYTEQASVMDSKGIRSAWIRDDTKWPVWLIQSGRSLRDHEVSHELWIPLVRTKLTVGKELSLQVK